MTKNQLKAASRLIDAVRQYVDYEEFKQPQRSERTPVHTITPKMFVELCKIEKVDNSTAYLLTAFALSLAKGMAENPGDIPTMCGGVNIPDGGSLIVAFEALSYSLSDKHKK